MIRRHHIRRTTAPAAWLLAGLLLALPMSSTWVFCLQLKPTASLHQHAAHGVSRPAEAAGEVGVAGAVVQAAACPASCLRVQLDPAYLHKSATVGQAVPAVAASTAPASLQPSDPALTPEAASFYPHAPPDRPAALLHLQSVILLT